MNFTPVIVDAGFGWRKSGQTPPFGRSTDLVLRSTIDVIAINHRGVLNSFPGS
jgi:hypothetical protein